MKPWFKKSVLIYWVILISTIGSNAYAETRVSEKVIPETSKRFSFSEVSKENSGFGLNHEPYTIDPVTDPVSVVPENIIVPAIGLEADIMEVGILDNGEMEVPNNINEVGWYEPGIKPGERGNAVLAGHLDGDKMPGAFYRLRELEKGDSVIVEGKGGAKLTFEVVRVQSYFTDDAPLDSIFGYHSDSRLNLITCSGNFNDSANGYEERLVVYTQLVKKE